MEQVGDGRGWWYPKRSDNFLDLDVRFWAPTWRNYCHRENTTKGGELIQVWLPYVVITISIYYSTNLKQRIKRGAFSYNWGIEQKMLTSVY